MGMMRLPLLDPNDQKSINYELATQMVDKYMARGFTYFDTAFMYHDGESEVFVREAIVKRYPRESYTVTDKMPAAEITTYDDLQRVFDIHSPELGWSISTTTGSTPSTRITSNCSTVSTAGNS